MNKEEEEIIKLVEEMKRTNYYYRIKMKEKEEEIEIEKKDKIKWNVEIMEDFYEMMEGFKGNVYIIEQEKYLGGVIIENEKEEEEIIKSYTLKTNKDIETIIMLIDIYLEEIYEPKKMKKEEMLEIIRSWKRRDKKTMNKIKNNKKYYPGGKKSKKTPIIINDNLQSLFNLSERRKQRIEEEKIKEPARIGLNGYIYNQLCERQQEQIKFLTNNIQKQEEYIEELKMEQEENARKERYVEKTRKNKGIINFIKYYVSTGVIGIIITCVGVVVKQTKMGPIANIGIQILRGALDIQGVVKYTGYAILTYQIIIGTLGTVPMIGPYVKRIPHPVTYILNQIVYKPFILPIQNFFAKIGGRIFGVEVEMLDKIQNKEIMYMYKSSQGEYKLLNKIQNELAETLLKNKTLETSEKVELINKLLVGGENPSLVQKVNSYFNGRLVEINEKKMEIISGKKLEWINNTKIPQRIEDIPTNTIFVKKETMNEVIEMSKQMQEKHNIIENISRNVENSPENVTNISNSITAVSESSMMTTIMIIGGLIFVGILVYNNPNEAKQYYEVIKEYLKDIW